MEITANAVQTVAVGQNVTFTETAVPGKCSIVHREGSGQVKVRALSCSGQCRARFKVTFGGNIAVAPNQTPGAISLALTLDGEPLGPASMIVTPGATNAYFNVFSAIFFDVPAGCCSTVGVRNTSTNLSVLVENANLIVERVA